jgi:hypothetical protein
LIDEGRKRREEGLELRTFPDIDDECTVDGRRIDPFAREVLDLEAFMRRSL